MLNKNPELLSWIKSRCVILENGCWEWQARRNPKGYGLFQGKITEWKMVRAHRAAFIALNGPINPSVLVCHRCDNPPCCNPDHLFLSTNFGNYLDSCLKNRRSYLRLKDEEVRLIRSSVKSHSQLGREFHRDRATIIRIRRRELYPTVE